MKEIVSENLRNVALVGHGHSGKTSLVSALLYNTKMVNRLGRVDQGNTVTDFDEEEIARKISIQASLAYAYKDKIKINLLDTPGFANFIWETMVALQAVETAGMVVSAQDGVQVQTEKIFDAVTEMKKPLFFIVNKMGKDLVDFDKDRYRRDEGLAVRRRRQGRKQGDPHPGSAQGRDRPAPRGAAGKDRRER
jgi:elongation factor G